MERRAVLFLLVLAAGTLFAAGAGFAAEPSTSATSVWVAVDRLHLRGAADQSASSLGLLHKGEELALLAWGRDWSLVKSQRLGEGWAATRYLATRQTGEVSRGSRSRTDELLAFARRWLGARYVYGCAGPSTFDCSGFTLYVFRTLGFILPHNALAQSRLGTPVSRADLLPGDLVFFATCGQTSINHVGIYLGNGEFIHASSGRGRVTISPLDSGYYEQHYVGATRILNDSAAEPARSAPLSEDERTSG